MWCPILTKTTIWGYPLVFHDATGDIISFIKRDFDEDWHGCRGLSEEPNVIVDVGAHIGMFSLLMAKRYPNAKIYAIEPIEENFENLMANNFLNACVDSVFPLQIAVGDGKDVNPYKHVANSGSISQFNSPDSQCETVKTKPLDELISSYTDLLKIDIEGSEYIALKRFTKWDQVKRLSLEVHKLPQLDDVDNAKIVQNLIDFVFSKMPKENVCVINPCTRVFYKWGQELTVEF